MEPPDVEVALPAGWRQLANDPGILAYSPAPGHVLQLSRAVRLAVARDDEDGDDERADDDALARQLVEFLAVVGGRVGTVQPWRSPYGVGVRASVAGARHDGRRLAVVHGWEITHDVHDPLRVTWIADSDAHTEAAIEIVANLAPGALPRLVGVAVEEVARQRIPNADYALLACGAEVQRIELTAFPPDQRDDAIRHIRAQRAAALALRVFVSEAGTAMVYGESAVAHRRVFVDDEVRSVGGPRDDYFRPPDAASAPG